jgi:predicted RNA-binding protein associated with RNAse of E/G family
VPRGRNPPAVEILEVKRTLSGAVLAFPCTAAEVTPCRAVLLYRAGGGRRVAGLDLPAGTVTVAYYWVDRPYNVYHWVSPAGETLGWYFNLSSPARIADGRVEWDDLEVDVLVTPPGLQAEVLDEDRVPAGLAPAQRAAIAAARERVLRECAAVAAELAASSPGFLRAAPTTR